eukprot:11312106-Alexandrium_andersonii.AAC.1
MATFAGLEASSRITRQGANNCHGVQQVTQGFSGGSMWNKVANTMASARILPPAHERRNCLQPGCE